MHGSACDLAEHSWALKADSYERSAGSVCDLAEQSWALKAGRTMNAVLGLCVT